MDNQKTLTSAFVRFLSGTLLSRLTGLLREVAMAAVFGTTPLVASFWMAFRFAFLFRRLFGEGALHVAFVPHFETLRKKDEKEASYFFYDLTKGLTLLLVAIVFILEGVLGAFLLFGNCGEDVLQILRLSMLLLPSLLFICLHAANCSLLQCETKFFLSSVSPVVLNVLWIGTLLLLRKMVPENLIEILAVVIVFGFALQWLLTQKAASQFLRNTPHDKNRKSRQSLFLLLRPFLLSTLGVAATQINTALDTLFARFADPEGPAILWYAIRLQQLPLGLLGVGISSALLPAIARAQQEGNKTRYLEFINFSLNRIILFLIPISFAILALGFVSVNLIYGHGEFKESSILETTAALWAYGIGLLPQTAVLILASAFYAIKDYKTPTFLSVGSIFVNCALNACFVFGLGMGAISVAFATSIAAFLNAILLAFFLLKKEGNFMQNSLNLLFKLSVAGICATTITLFLTHVIWHENTLSFLLAFPMSPFPTTLFTQLQAFAFQFFIFAFFLFTLLILLKIISIPKNLRKFI